MSRALAAGGTKLPGVHVEGVWNSLLLSVTAGRCLPGGPVPPLDGAFGSGTGVWHWCVCGNSGGICNSLTKESFNVQNLESVIRCESFKG